MTVLAALLLACTPLLHAPRAYESGGALRIVAVDVDADGSPDVVTSGGSVLYGGNGTLGEPVALPMAKKPATVDVADVDADGLPDVIATELGNSDQPRRTLLLRNLGQRRFGAPELIATELPGAMAIGDFTNDGAPDVVIAREKRNGLLFRNDGRGHFTAEETTAIDLDAAVAGDVDGDGKLDLVHARASQRLVIERGDGNGRFTPQMMTFWSPMTAALEDLDGDGRDDLLAMFGTMGDLFVYRSPIDFTKSTHVAAGAPRVITSGDFNGDGRIDIAVLSHKGTTPESSPRVLVFLNGGDGKLVRSRDVLIGPEIWYGGASSTEALATADFNGDGILDLVVPAGDTRLGLVFGRGDGTFDTPSILQARPHTTLLEALDLNGDGVDELIAADSAGYPVVGVQTDDGTYHFELVPVPGVARAAGDANEQGWRTLLVAGISDKLSVVSRSADGVWSLVREYPGRAYGFTAADLDGDGKREIVVMNERRLRVLDADGNERFSLEGAPPAFFSILAVDVNHDARLDLIVSRRGTDLPMNPFFVDDGFVALYLGRGDGTLEAEQRLVDGGYLDASIAADFNGDGNVDILPGKPVLLRGDGHGGFVERPAPLTFGPAADLNGDGLPELLGYGNTLIESTRGGFVRRGTYVLDSADQNVVFARRAAGARPTLVGVMGDAGELYLVDVECGAPRGRIARH